MNNPQDQSGTNASNMPGRNPQNPGHSPTSPKSTSTPGTPTENRPTGAADYTPTGAERQSEGPQANAATEGHLLDTALNSGKKWIEDSGVLNGVSQLPQSLKDLGNRAVARVNDLSTTQKVVGGALLAVGLGWLATRKGKTAGSADTKSSAYNYGRQRDAGSYGRSKYGYQAPDASASHPDSGAPYGSGNRFGSASGSGKGSDSGVGVGASATTDHGAQAKGNSPRSAGSGFGSTDDV